MLTTDQLDSDRIDIKKSDARALRSLGLLIIAFIVVYAIRERPPLSLRGIAGFLSSVVASVVSAQRVVATCTLWGRTLVAFGLDALRLIPKLWSIMPARHKWRNIPGIRTVGTWLLWLFIGWDMLLGLALFFLALDVTEFVQMLRVPAVLFLSKSSPDNIILHHRIAIFSSHHGVVSLLDPTRSDSGRASFQLYSLIWRTSEKESWEATTQVLMSMVKVIAVDMRDVTAYVRQELAWIREPSIRSKIIALASSPVDPSVLGPEVAVYDNVELFLKAIGLRVRYPTDSRSPMEALPPGAGYATPTSAIFTRLGAAALLIVSWFVVPVLSAVVYVTWACGVILRRTIRLAMATQPFSDPYFEREKFAVLLLRIVGVVGAARSWLANDLATMVVGFAGAILLFNLDLCLFDEEPGTSAYETKGAPGPVT